MGLSRFELPGFGLPLNFIPAGTGEEDDDEDDLFPNALNSLHLKSGATQYVVFCSKHKNSYSDDLGYH